MRIIIDGYNLIRRWPELAMLDRADLALGREALLRELQAYQRARRHQITVVFDGCLRGDVSGGAERAGGVGVRYSRQGETADAVIVSSDREVQAAARRHGAGHLDADEFLARLEQSRVAALKGSEGEVEGRPTKSGKGAARRLPKRVRRAERRLRGL